MAGLQSFATPDHRAAIPGRLAAVRAALPTAAFLLPRADAFLGESMVAADERLAWLTGFTGSAGTCLLLPDRALLFLDGRYLEQGRTQTDGFEIVDIQVEDPVAWVRRHLPAETRLGVDPWLHSIAFLGRLDGRLLRLDGNPVDPLWRDRPARPAGPVRGLPPELAGESSAAKRDRLAAGLRADSVDAFLLASPDSVCWLFNLRGSDTPHTPLVQARGLLLADGGAVLLAAPDRLGPAAESALGPGVRLAPPDELEAELARLAGSRLAMDRGATPDALRLLAARCGATPVCREDPVAVPRARKNDAELAGMRRAHRLDGVAMAGFLAWLDRNGAGLTEIDVAEQLERCRLATGELDGLAFDTIAAAGPNAALPHYRVNRASNRPLGRGELLLVDSGGQYRTGTTDLTRTVALGPVPDRVRDACTEVLRAMIRLTLLEFPGYATGIALDAITRESLWRAGFDYAHGTGHGVGAGLSVHEGPFALAPRGPNALRPLQPGLVVSNEPGVYVTGAFGIRIENLLVCREVTPGDASRLRFETLTLAPIDLRPVRTKRLRRRERRWLDAYHARVRAEISPGVDAETRDWLDRACRPLAEAGR